MTKSTSFFVLGILIGLVAAGGWFAWLGQGGDGQGSDVKVLKVAHALPQVHPVHQGLEHFAQRLSELSTGTLEVRIYPSEQLGTETQCLEKVQAGTLDITKTSAAPIGNFVPAYKIFSLPYLFRDEAHYWNVLNGPVGAKMLDVVGKRADGSPSGLVGLGYFDGGSRSFYTVAPAKVVADLEGRKIRVMNDQVAMDLVKAVGGSPTPIAFGELYTALKQGTVDGAENNPPSFVSSRHYEICKHYLLDHHSRIPDVIVISASTWDKLDEAQRGWVRQAMLDATDFQRELWASETQRCLEVLEKEGVTVIEPDLQPFRDAVAPIIEKYSDEVTTPLIRSIQQVD